MPHALERHILQLSIRIVLTSLVDGGFGGLYGRGGIGCALEDQQRSGDEAAGVGHEVCVVCEVRRGGVRGFDEVGLQDELAEDAITASEVPDQIQVFDAFVCEPFGWIEIG